MKAIKDFINLFADPRYFFILSVVALVFIVWKREVFAKNAMGYGLMAFLVVFFAFGLFDENFRLIIAKPDNVPIVALIFLIIFFTWYSMRQAVLNDKRIAAGHDPIEKQESGRVGVWPDLVYTELIALVLCTAVLVIWSIVLEAHSSNRRIRRTHRILQRRPGISWGSRKCSSTSTRGWLAWCSRA